MSAGLGTKGGGHGGEGLALLSVAHQSLDSGMGGRFQALHRPEAM